MKALILAAGMGKRLGEKPGKTPKALISVGGQPLIHHQLYFLHHSSITEIGIVGGYQFESLRTWCSTQTTKIKLFENKNYTAGNILSLQAAREFLDDGFLLMNVDHIYPRSLLDTLLKQVRGITAACDFDRPLAADDMKIQRDAKGCLQSIDKQLKNYDGGYIGMTVVPREKRTIYLSGLEKVLASRGPSASVEMILDYLAEQKEPIAIADTSGIRWLEIDTEEDWERAETKLRKGPPDSAPDNKRK